MKKLLPWAVAAAFAAATSAYADIKLNDNVTLSGYAVGAYTTYAPNPGSSSDSLFDASKAPPGAGDSNAIDLTFTANYKPVTAVVSLFDFPGTDLGLNILDAYVAYDAGDGITITGGKFLSYLGYESFYPTLMSQISYANGDFLGAIPAYHSGIKLDYAGSSGTGFGVAMLDSVYSPYGYNRGDGELAHNAGFEGYISQVSGPVTVWAGFGYDSKGNFESHSVLTLDFWLSYALNKETTLAAEYQHKDGGDGAKGYNWLAFANFTFTDKVSTAFRVSGEKMDDTMGVPGPGFTKYTICPAYAVTDHLSVRLEYSYYDYKDYTYNEASFFGVQALFKF